MQVYVRIRCALISQCTPRCLYLATEVEVRFPLLSLATALLGILLYRKLSMSVASYLLELFYVILSL